MRSDRGQGPVRTCMGCGERGAQRELVRFQAGSRGGLALAPESGRRGRSAYLHRRESCWQRFATRKGLVRSLRRSVDRSTRSAFVALLREDEGGTQLGKEE